MHYQRSFFMAVGMRGRDAASRFGHMCPNSGCFTSRLGA
nr:putative antitoxin [uncultured Alphaproteobacteria bacterium]